MRFLPHILVGTLLTLGLGAAWLTQNPDAAVLEAAQDWPLVGEWASRFRRAYLSPEIAPPEAAEGVVADSLAGYEAESGRLVVGARPIVWLPEDSTFHAEPDATSPILFETGAVTNVKVLETQGDWHLVLYRGRPGWVELGQVDAPGAPPFGSEPTPPGPLPARTPDPDQVTSAREYLSGTTREHRIGPYTLFTDSGDDELVRSLDGLASQIESVYVSRYERPVVGEPDGVVILYSSEAGYRAYQLERDDGGNPVSIGHTGSGVVTLYVGEQSLQQVGAVLVHELVHLLNRRGLGPVLPAWLEEGTADDLAHSAVEAGRIDPTRIGGEIVQDGDLLSAYGGWASISIVRRARSSGRAPEPSQLIAMDRDEFNDPEKSSLHYGASALLVRYLLETEELAPGFREYLTSVAAGGEVDGSSPARPARRLSRAPRRRLRGVAIATSTRPPDRGRETTHALGRGCQRLLFAPDGFTASVVLPLPDRRLPLQALERLAGGFVGGGPVG